LSQLGQGDFCELKVFEGSGIEDQLDDTVALLMLTHVNFRTGKLHDIRKLTKVAHDKGILVIWDLAHSTGVLPLSLDEWGVDFAVGCGYKYLNGGPGAPAFIYAAERHHASIRQPLSGWMGHRAPFAFDENYTAAPGVQQFLCGTPPVLSMSVLDASLSVFENVDMQVLRTKSVALGELFIQLIADNDSLGELTLISPKKSSERGSQVALAHPEAYSICQALIERNVIADFRTPDVLRFGFAPLYLSHQDIWKAVHILADVMASKIYSDEKFSRVQKVT
jgi:kynureninase